MIAPKECVAIVLAAGRSTRYGSADKLLEQLDGKPLARHIGKTLSRIGFGQHIAVVAHPEVGDIFADLGFNVTPVEANQPMGASLEAGLGAIERAEHVLVCLADMPFVTADHLEALLETGDAALVVATGGPHYRGPPMRFPLSRRSMIEGAKDQGARTLLSEAILVQASSALVADIDTVEDMARWDHAER